MTQESPTPERDVSPATEKGRELLKQLMDEFEGEYPYEPGSDGYERRKNADAAVILAIEQEAAAIERRKTVEQIRGDDWRDEHERAMRDHILAREHTCDDLCSDDIVDRYAARLSPPSSDRGA